MMKFSDIEMKVRGFEGTPAGHVLGFQLILMKRSLQQVPP